MSATKCEGCGRVIRSKETGHIHEDRVLCPECYRKATLNKSRHETPQTRVKVPSYLALSIVGQIIVATGIVTMMATILVGIVAFKSPLTDPMSGRLIAVGTLFAMFIGGLFQVAWGQGILAFRDMALNSWKAVAPTAGH